MGSSGENRYSANASLWNTRDLERKLEEFRNSYNSHRVHASLGGDTPMEFRGVSCLQQNRSSQIPLTHASSQVIPTANRGLTNNSLSTGLLSLPTCSILPKGLAWTYISWRTIIRLLDLELVRRTPRSVGNVFLLKEVMIDGGTMGVRCLISPLGDGKVRCVDLYCPNTRDVFLPSMASSIIRFALVVIG